MCSRCRSRHQYETAVRQHINCLTWTIPTIAPQHNRLGTGSRPTQADNDMKLEQIKQLVLLNHRESTVRDEEIIKDLETGEVDNLIDSSTLKTDPAIKDEHTLRDIRNDLSL